jgi:hypothetical protein
MQRVRALIDCCVNSIFMSLRLQKLLGLADEQAHVTTLGLGGQVMVHASDSQKTAFAVQQTEHLSLVRESEVLVAPIWAYDWVLGLPWFLCRNPYIVWQSGRLLALRTAGGAEVVAVDRVDHLECPGNERGSTAKEEA